LCFECGQPADHRHHVVPRSLGGTKTVDLCAQHHASAHGLDEKTWIRHPELTKAALQVKRSQGQRTGQVPYGKQLAADGVHLEDNENEQRVLVGIRSLRDEGLSIRAIAERLNLDSVPARGARWHPTTVARILKAERGVTSSLNRLLEGEGPLWKRELEVYLRVLGGEG
jgi:hypothetical protein